MAFVIRRFQELARPGKSPLCKCFIDVQRAYDPVSCDLLWAVLARYGAPPGTISAVRQLHGIMRVGLFVYGR